VKVLVVDDSAPVRNQLKQLLQLKTSCEVVGEGTNGEEALTGVEQLKPDVVLMDMNMPIMSGVEATKRIREKHPDVKVLALTAFGDMTLVTAMIQAGASGYLLKGGSSEELIQSLQAIGKGHAALDKEVTRGVMDDMAELLAKEQERAAMLAELDRMKSEFVSVVSHELRTPITNIKGGVLTLKRGWEMIEETQKMLFLDSIARQCDRLSSMVHQILTVSGIQRGGLGLKATTFYLDQLARDAIENLAPKTADREVVVDLEPVRTTGDRDRLKDVATALVQNALDFTEGRIRVEAREENGWSKLRVIDEGPGLDQPTLHTLLNKPFTQADSSHTRKVGGLGLSLYIARQVLEASGGRLEISTGPETGSRFTMVLPAPSIVDHQ
jgi:signal transduction histidine kinase